MCGAPRPVAVAAAPPVPPPSALAGGGSGSSGGGGSSRHPVAEPSIKILPNTRWEDIAPGMSCAHALRTNAHIRRACPRIDSIVADCEAKAVELQFEDDLPAALSTDQTVALTAYSHDLGTGVKAGNLYFELNGALRKRGKDDRSAMMTGWGVFMHYIMGALALLPMVGGVCYRGYPDKAAAVAHYKLGRPIQWGAFSSTSTDFAVTTGFTDRENGVIFKITVTDGRDINAYSFFPMEGEVLLSPSHRFMVCSTPYERDGYTVIDMCQQEGSTFIS